MHFPARAACAGRMSDTDPAFEITPNDQISNYPSALGMLEVGGWSFRVATRPSRVQLADGTHLDAASRAGGIFDRNLDSLVQIVRVDQVESRRAAPWSPRTGRRSPAACPFRTRRWSPFPSARSASARIEHAALANALTAVRRIRGRAPRAACRVRDTPRQRYFHGCHAHR
jgi:hypothetical protein